MRHPDPSAPRIDRATAERLLNQPGEAPDPSLAPLAAVLGAAADHRTRGPLPREGDILEAFRAWAQERGTSADPAAAGMSWQKRVAAVAAAAGLVFGTGVTAAAAGALPDGPQGVAEELLSDVGIDVPGPEEPATPAEPRQPAEAPAPRPARPSAPPTSTHGSEVSDVATSTAAKGVNKGEEVSGAASGGKAGGNEKGNGTRD